VLELTYQYFITETKKNIGTSQGKIHNVQHPIKDYQHTKRQENMIHDKEYNQFVETNPSMISIEDHFVCFKVK
jgi:hypothetical protein